MRRIIEKANALKHVLVWSLSLGVFVLSSCKKEDPHAEHDHEVINKVTLSFQPITSATDTTHTPNTTPVTAVYNDPDGPGSTQPTIGIIGLEPQKSYLLTIKLENTLEGKNENTTNEIKQEANFHMFFFKWLPSELFTSPSSGGNILPESNKDMRQSSPAPSTLVNYQDKNSDYKNKQGVAISGNEKVGIKTTWTTGAATTSNGKFQVILKHQTSGGKTLKTATSTSNVGTTDTDVTFPISIRAK